MNIRTSLIIIFLLVTTAVNAQNKGLAQSPPMGWNSWNYFGKKNVDEKLIVDVIDAISKSGLKDAGYEYVVVDGGWRDTVLGPNGELIANKKFPRGMKYLADYAHSKGLKFGLHTVPGSHDCGGDKVGGWNHEEVQMKQFEDWGIDFIKMDRCRFSLDDQPDKKKMRNRQWYTGWDTATGNLYKAYKKWADLVANSKRKILYSASVYRFYDWYPELTNMSRTTGDINSGQSGGAVFDDPNSKPHLSVMTIADRNDKHAAHARPGYWNDPDMLVTGEQGLNYEEQKAHFALWCIMSSPLILGNDPRNMTEQEKSIILNREAIAINQDPTEQGRRIKKDGTSEVWVKKLKGGSYGVLLLNRDKVLTKTISLKWDELAVTGKKTVRDIYAKKNLGVYEGHFSADLKPHHAQFILVKK